jgi:hypothetical protein
MPDHVTLDAAIADWLTIGGDIIVTNRADLLSTRCSACGGAALQSLCLLLVVIFVEYS